MCNKTIICFHKKLGALYEGDQMFHRYIVPNGNINRKATDIHGLSKRGNILHHRNKGEIFYAVTPRKGLQKFVNWLQELKEETKSSIVLCSYNNRKFDSKGNILKRCTVCQTEIDTDPKICF